MLKIEHVTKVFNKDEGIENIKVALNDINIEVENGEFITVIGGNGSGKSTFVNVICGVHEVDNGKISIDGIDVTKMKEHNRAKYLGHVFQDPMMGTAANMSIYENLNLAMRRTKKRTLKWALKKSDEKSLKEKIATLNLGLENRMNQRVGLLSGGQRQAITLIMATFNKPKLLLLDEHTAALDPKTAKNVLTLTDKIVHQEKITTIMITHNMRDAIKYGNRLIMFNNGKIIFDIKGKEKENLTIEQLLKKFEENGDIEINDRMLLS